jgi:hypothetical protein
LEGIAESEYPVSFEQIEKRFKFFSSPDNTLLSWEHIPDAWDGSTNYAVGSGSIQLPEAGHCLLTYNKKIGAEKPQ